jgi:hypothetical protein
MALTRWEPFEGLTSLRREMDRLFEHFFERGPVTMGDGGMFEPAIEIADTNDSIMVKAQVPGVSKENLHLDIMDDCLTLKGEIKDEETTEGKRFHRRETLPPEGISLRVIRPYYSAPDHCESGPGDSATQGWRADHYHSERRACQNETNPH